MNFQQFFKDRSIATIVSSFEFSQAARLFKSFESSRYETSEQGLFVPRLNFQHSHLDVFEHAEETSANGARFLFFFSSQFPTVSLTDFNRLAANGTRFN